MKTEQKDLSSSRNKTPIQLLFIALIILIISIVSFIYTKDAGNTNVGKNENRVQSNN